MYKFLSIKTRRKCLFFWLTRDIFVDLWRGDKIPEIPNSETVLEVRFEWAMGTSRFPNGEGYYNKTRVFSRTLDGEQTVIINGPDVADAMKALDDFTNSRLPENWEASQSFKSIPMPRIVIDCPHHHFDDYDIIGSR